MRLAAISDIHGNLPALEAVLADIARSGAEVTVNLGDIVSGPLWPAETAQRLMALQLPTIRGNHERQVLAAPPERLGASDAFAARQLAPEQRAWLAALPATMQLDAQVFCCHGTPASDVQYWLESLVAAPAPGDDAAVRAATLAEATERAGAAQRGIAGALLLCGHTHAPRAVQLADGRLVVNPGSVGLQAYDDEHPQPHVIENGSPHARYALLGRSDQGWQVELRCVPYDHEAAARQAERHGRPDWADALRSGRVGRREADALARGTSGMSAR